MNLRVDKHLSAAEVAQVRTLVEAVAGQDGHPPLSDHVMLHLPVGGDGDVRHLLVEDDGRLIGYAHLEVTDPGAGASAELAVLPEARRRGVGRALVEALLAQRPDGRLQLWAHGEHPAAVALARELGFSRGRVLWQMRRPLAGPSAPPLPEVRLPAGVALRTFVVGQDEQAWTEVNHRAFAAHPDQGGWTAGEVRLREREPWFDPYGFFLAERVEGSHRRLVGFHWTKVHGGGEDDPQVPIGEVYVIGVDPDEQGTGLGRALTAAGLHHLRESGLETVMLYVDETNPRAIALYERLGFARWASDVCFRHG